MIQVLPWLVEESPLGDLLWCWLLRVLSECGRVCNEWPASMGSLVVLLWEELASDAEVGRVP